VPYNLFPIPCVLDPSIHAIFYFRQLNPTLCDSLSGLDVFIFVLLPFAFSTLQFCVVRRHPIRRHHLLHQLGSIFFVGSISLRSCLIYGGVVSLLHGPSLEGP
jgi:hypothetical protein